MTQNDARLERGADGRLLLSGALSFASVPQLQAQLEPLLGEGETVIDLGGVQRSDSAGLALLVEWLRVVRRRGGELVFRNFPEQMKTMAEVSHVYELLNQGNPPAS